MKQSLSATGIIKTFGNKTVLDNAYMRCETGEITGIFGRNGCGKSTLLKVIFGTQKAESVSVSIDGKHFSPKEIIAKQKIAYLPQDPFLPKNKTVKNVIPMVLEKGSQQDKLLYLPEINKLADTKVGELSMGQLRYLELLLIAYLPHPFLMLDEPFSMVEPLYKEKIKEFLLKLKKEKGIIITDHYYADVLEISDKNMLLKNGKIIPIDNSQELVTHGYLTSVNV